MATNESVRVFIRFRPFNKSERKKASSMEPWKTLQDTDPGIKMKHENNELSLYNIQEHGSNFSFKKKKEKFYFDSLMDDKTTQTQAFEKVAQQICDEILQGYNGTIFVYGQSGSGKTHTMYGPEDKKDSEDIEEMGIIPQSCAYIFNILNNKDHPLVEGMLDYEVQCEFCEIYNNNLKDLLDLNNKPEIREFCINAHKDEWRVILKNVQRRKVRNLGEVLTAIRFASKHRTVAGTNLNATSSRSHMIMRLFVTVTTADGKRTGIANFSDLAGSEKVKKTGAKGQQLKEAQNILLSLSSLSRTIEAIVKGAKNPPFKDSKLTFLLKDSLGGNCKTALLIAASPHVFNRDETVRSLQFGERCRKIQNKAKINTVRTKSQLIKENEALKKQIEELKKNGVQNDFVMIDDEKSIEKEKEKFEQRIKALEAANENYKERIEQISKQKEENDEYWQKINNEFDDLKLQHTELTRDYDTKEKTLQEIEKSSSDLKQANDILQTQTNELQQKEKVLSQESKQLEVENARLKEKSQEQKSEIDKLKGENEKIQTEQTNLQNKWKQELESKKSQFTKQEMELSQQIEGLQLQIEQKEESQLQTKRELRQNQDKLKKMEINVHKLQDDNTKIGNELGDVKEKNSTLSTENETLKTRIQDLLSQLEQERMKNKGFHLKLTAAKDKYQIEIGEQENKANELEFQLEQKVNQVQAKESKIKAMEKEHKQEIENLKSQMQAVADLNKQLQEENQTATEVVGVQQDQISKHRRQVTDIKQENSVIIRQLQQLQSHYSKVVQDQIAADEKYARDIQRKENQEYFQKKRESATFRRKGKPRNENSLQLAGVDGDDDDDESEELLPGNGVTLGGPANYEKEILDEFTDDEEDDNNDNNLEDIKEENEDIDDDDDDDDDEKKVMESQVNKGQNEDDDSSEESSEDDIDPAAQSQIMFSRTIKRKRESLSIQRKNQNSQLNPRMVGDDKNQNMNNNDDEAMKRMMEMRRKQMEMDEQLQRDMKLAQDIFNQQQNLHGQAWNKYGAPEMSKLERERQEELAEKQRQKDEKHRQYLAKNYVALDKLEETKQGTNLNQFIDPKQQRKKDKKKKKKRKSQVIEQEQEQENQYLDTNDGMGQIVIMDDDAEY